MKFKKIKKFLPIIGIAIFIYLLIKLNIFSVFNEISNARIDFLMIALVFVFVSILTETSKWFIIARYQKIKVPFLEAVKINLISSFYGFVTPSKVGSVMRSEYLKKYQKSSLGKGLSNFVLDKVLDLCSLCLLVAFFSFIFREIFSANIFYYAIVLFFVGIIGFLIFTNEGLSKKILKVIYKKLIPAKLKEKAKDGFYSFYEDMPKKRYFPLFFLINVANWIVIFSISFFVGRAIGIEVPFFYFLAILPVGTLIAQIPITISGLGVREITLIGLFGLFGVEATKVFSMSIISLFLAGIIPAIIAILFVIKKKINVQKK